MLLPQRNAGTTRPSQSPIRSIDFANFTYPASDLEYRKESFMLRDGKVGDWRDGMAMVGVHYGDVTGDGEEEAIVNLAELTDGNQAINAVYIYSLEQEEPKLLWAFESGDRGDGGLRRVYAQGGKLVIELFGKNTRIDGGTSSTEFIGMCCAKSITRTYYRWDAGRFEPVGESEVFPNPDAPLIVPLDRAP